MNAIPCPDDKMPANCRKAIRIAEANGYAWACTYAIGPEPDRIQSVLLRVAPPGEVLRSWARWETGKAGSKTEGKLGFHCAFLRSASWPLAVNFTEFLEYLGNQPKAPDVQSI